MVDFKVHSFKTFKPNKVFLLIILFWCYTNLCSASGIGNVPYISYISPIPPRPMSIRTEVQPILPPDGENALEEIDPMPYVQHGLVQEVEHAEVQEVCAHVPAHVQVPPIALSPPQPPTEIQVDSNYTNSTIQKPTAVMNCLIEDFDIISIAVSNRLSNLFEKKAEIEMLDRKKFWRRFLKGKTKQKGLSNVTILVINNRATLMDLIQN